MDPAVNHIQQVIVDPSFTRDIMPVLRASCGSSGACHGIAFGPGPQLGLELETDSGAYATMVNVPSNRRPQLMLVRPGFADSSFVYRVLSSDSTYRLLYPWRMPMTEYALPFETRETIKNWINKGAQFN